MGNRAVVMGLTEKVRSEGPARRKRQGQRDHRTRCQRQEVARSIPGASRKSV